MQYNENEIEKILQEYKLSDEEHKELYNTIKRIWTLDKFPVENPIAVIIGVKQELEKVESYLIHKKCLMIET